MRRAKILMRMTVNKARITDLSFVAIIQIDSRLGAQGFFFNSIPFANLGC